MKIMAKTLQTIEGKEPRKMNVFRNNARPSVKYVSPITGQFSKIKMGVKFFLQKKSKSIGGVWAKDQTLTRFFS